MAIDVATVRKVARLARIAEPEERLEALAQELNGIMTWIEQLAEVDTDGVEPLTSVVGRRRAAARGCGDHGRRRLDRHLQRAQVRRRLLRRAQGGRIMSALTSLTLKGAIDGLEAGDFTSVELTTAHIEAIEGARALNAFIVETPEQAIAMAAASDARRALGAAGPLDGAPLGIKDLFCTKGVQTTACSKILEGFVPNMSRPSPASCGATAR
jgi:Asp-tRNA(Asn)/Glu-tRNA(Gln) amidotransferase C subunit